MERWQQALSKWNKWSESIEKTQTRLRKKYEDIDELIKGANIKFETKNEGSANESYSFILNVQMVTKWEIETELEQ